MAPEHPRRGQTTHALLGIVASLAVCLPGCAWDRTFGADRDTTRVAQRPTYPIEGTRPLYLGGYAGANYNPVTRPFR
jgi:hypothetical protein